MKCVCGYTGEDFIKLEYVSEQGINISFFNIGDTDNFYACPKCGTLKIDINDNKDE